MVKFNSKSTVFYPAGRLQDRRRHRADDVG